MKYILSFLALALSFTSFGQLTITPQSSCDNYTLTTTFTGSVPTASGITADDAWSGVFNLGFTFNFYGVNQTQCIIGSNGLIGFTLSYANAYNTWPINNTLGATAATGGDIQNCVAGPWNDMQVSNGGSIQYATVGTAPNRKFEVTFCADHLYSCNTQYTTAQIILYETTNVVEVHVGHRTICAWNGGYAEIGVVNTTAASAVVAPGPPVRDYPTQWTANPTPEAWRFTPSGSSFTVSSIPYAPLPYASSAIYWYDSTTHQYLGTGPNIVVTPTVTTTYEAVAIGCGDSTKTFITLGPSGTGGGAAGAPHISNIISTNALACGACNGTIKLYGVHPGQIDTVFWTKNGIPQAPYVTTTASDSIIRVNNLCPGTYSFFVKVLNCVSNTVTATITAPVLVITSDSKVDPTVCGKCDGFITLNGLWADSVATVHYSHNGGPTQTYTGTVLGNGSITIPNLCAGTYRNITATIGLCTAQGDSLTLIDPPPFPASFTYSTVMHCNGDEIDLTNTSTPAGYNSTWSYNDGTPSDHSTNTTHIFHDEASNYQDSVTVTLSYNEYGAPGCTTTSSQVVHFDHPIDAHIILPYPSVCLPTAQDFYGNTINHNMPTFTWNTGDGTANVIGTNAPAGSPGTDFINYTYPAAGDYTATLTVTDTIGCKATDVVDARAVSISVRVTVSDTSVCLRDSMLMHAIVNVVPNYVTYMGVWTPADSLGNTTFVGTGDGVYPVKYRGLGDPVYTITVNTTSPGTDPAPCTASDVETIHSYPPVTLVGLTTSQTIPWGTSIQLSSFGALYYTWSPNNGTLDNPNINNPIATPIDTVTTYIVYGMSEYGCLASDTVVITMAAQNALMPSAFTPNGDGLNDLFRVTNMTFEHLIDFSVYNRWGQMVFHTADRNIGWDGTWNGVPQDMGVYTYHVILGLVDGTTKSFEGTVTLIR